MRSLRSIRSRRGQPGAVRRSARRPFTNERKNSGSKCRTPRTLRNEDENARFHSLDADLAVVAAYGLILPKPILAGTKRGCINVHASLLPRWRGAAPIQRAILAGDEVSGVTIMLMDEGLDTGPMLLKREVRIDGKNAGQVTEELANLGAKAILEYLRDRPRPEAQPNDGATYAPKIDKVETRIDWTDSAKQIVRSVRAFNPVPGAWFEANGERIKLLEATEGCAAGKPGEVLDDRLNVATSDGCVQLLKVQRAGRGTMTASDLLRGFAVPKGTILR